MNALAWALTALAISSQVIQVAAIDTIRLHNAAGAEVEVISTGAIVQRLLIPTASGSKLDIVAGFDNPEEYSNNYPYFGAIIGRVVSRIANATFELDGQTYHTSVNENNNTQHGGKVGWSAKQWTLTPFDSDEGQAVALSLYSPDGDEGFPNAVNATVVYTLTDTNDVILDYFAVSDGPTPINMVSHSYFNLEGVGSNKTVLDHQAFINASYLTPLDRYSVPYGSFEDVSGTPYDFRTPHTIGSRIYDVKADFRTGGGYDVNYVLWGLDGPQSKAATQDCRVLDAPQLAASFWAPGSGLAMDVLAETPGLELYTANGLDGSLAGKGGERYPQFGAFCPEAQLFPNFVNEPGFAQCILQPSQPYQQRLIWHFYNATGPNLGN